MIDIYTIGIGFGIKMVTAVIAFMILRYSLGYLDKRSGFDFKAWQKKASSKDISLYLSARLIAVAILFASIM